MSLDDYKRGLITGHVMARQRMRDLLNQLGKRYLWSLQTIEELLDSAIPLKAGEEEFVLAALDELDWAATVNMSEEELKAELRAEGLDPDKVADQPYCADCDSPCEFGECDPPHLCRKHAACARCNPCNSEAAT